jgi:hypothetical protein
MIFNVDSKEIQNALEKIQVKGKHLSSNGFSSSSIGSLFWAELEGNNLSIWNGDATLICCLKLEVEGEANGNFIGDAKEIIPFLKSFTDTVQFSVDDSSINITVEGKGATIPKVAIHSGFDAITRMRTLIKHMNYEAVPQTIFAFNKTPLEGAFTLSQEQFADTIKSCELAKTGIYKLDYKDNLVHFTSGSNTASKFNVTLTPAFHLGEPATLEFSSPLYSFFDKGQLLNFYVKDEFPVIIVSNDRLLLKAPAINN